MNNLHLAETAKVLPLLGPIDKANVAFASSYLRVRDANWITFLVSFGNMTSDSTDTVTITVESSTAGSSNATEAAIAFNYRKSSAVDTDSMGAITAATSDGVAITAADDNKVLIIDVDPAGLPAASGQDDPRFLRVVGTPTTGLAINIVGIMAIVEGRYPGNAIPSAT